MSDTEPQLDVALERVVAHEVALATDGISDPAIRDFVADVTRQKVLAEVPGEWRAMAKAQARLASTH